jgi:hypothetical protein
MLKKSTPDVFEMIFNDEENYAHFVRSAIIFLGMVGASNIDAASHKLDHMKRKINSAKSSHLNDAEAAALIMHHALEIARIAEPLIKYKPSTAIAH